MQLSVTCGCLCSPMNVCAYPAISRKHSAAPSALQATIPICLGFAGRCDDIRVSIRTHQIRPLTPLARMGDILAHRPLVPAQHDEKEAFAGPRRTGDELV